MTTLSVRFEGDAAGPSLRAVLASMPNRFRLADTPAADVLVVTGGAPISDVITWASASAGCRAIVVTSPGVMALAQLEELETAAASAGWLLVPALRFAPRLAVIDGGTPATDLADIALVDSVVETADGLGPTAVDALVEQLAVVRRLVAPVVHVTVHHRTATTSVVGAAIDGTGASVTLTAVVSPIGADRLRLRIIGTRARSDIELDASTLARPARLSRFDGGGERIERPVHQHAHRLTMQRVHELLTSGAGVLDVTAGALREDLTTAHSAG